MKDFVLFLVVFLVGISVGCALSGIISGNPSWLYYGVIPFLVAGICVALVLAKYYTRKENAWIHRTK